MKTKLLIIVISTLIIGASSCKTDDDFNPVICTTEYVYGLKITLKDIDTDAIITEGVTIEAIDGPHQETLVLSESSNSFYGAGERAGTYTLTITSPDYQTYVSDPIEVSRDECHVITETIEILLQPN